jgi:transglutaminase-like putative cysteine protease
MSWNWRSPFLALLLLDAVAVATFARCFSGPSELLLLVPVCIGAQLVAHAARLLAARGNRLVSLAVWLLAMLLVAWVPVLAVDFSTVTGGLPIGHGASVLARQLSGAWHIFSVDVAPVSTQSGLVIASAWAAGAVALAAEVLDADRSLPALVALVPAFDVVLFTGTLGTSTGRPLELAAAGALGVLYLSSSTGRSSREQVVVARLDGRYVSNGKKPTTARPSRSAAPGLAALAAVAAGVVGPLLPGATSRALITWHGSGNGGHGTRPGSGGTRSSLDVSTLVQVGEEEVDNPNTVIATVHSSLLTREVLVALDDFNGNQWTPAALPGGPVQLPSPRVSISKFDASPPSEEFTKTGPRLTQVITIEDYGGPYLPTPGTAVSVGDLRVLAEPISSRPLIPVTGFRRGETYAVTADVNPPPPGSDPAEAGPGLSGGVQPGGLPLSVDEALPGPIPADIVSLAHAVVLGARTTAARAQAIAQFFNSNPAFHYALPHKLKSGAITDTGSGYSALEQFLFHSRTGYCQQFASAFAVLARIDGLPARVVVGFLPGQGIGADAWEITGQDVHAWPQVYFPGVGWSDYEPTPGTPTPLTFPKTKKPSTTVTSTLPGGQGVSTTTLPTNLRMHNHLPGGPTHQRSGRRGTIGARSTRGPGGGGFSSGDLALGFLALAGLWVLAVPTARVLTGHRRRLDPSRGVLSSWREVVRVLAAAGYHRRRTETYSEFAQRVRLAGVLSGAGDDALRRLALEVNRAAFGRGPLSRGDISRAAVDARTVSRAAWRRVTWRQRLVAELDPRDLFRVA